MVDKLSSEGLKAAADTTKQIMALSTGVVTLTVTFLEKIVQPQTTGATGRSVPWTMFAAWICFGLAILAALITLGAVTGTLDALDRKQNGLPVNAAQKKAVAALSNGPNVQWPARAMSFLFVLGMVLTIATALLPLR